MTKAEINEFIETMGEIGDEWTPEEVERVYGNKSLQDALGDRKANLGKFDYLSGSVFVMFNGSSPQSSYKTII